MQQLPKWVLPPTMPSVYESESFTSLEMVSKLYGAVNELINQHNTFTESISKKMEEFTAQTEEQYNLFATDLRQEFQDFIDVVDLKIRGMQQTMDNIDSIAQAAVERVINAGGIVIESQYNEPAESLNLVVTGG